MQIVLNAMNLSEYARMPLTEGESAIGRLLARFENAIVITNTERPMAAQVLCEPSGDIAAVCTHLVPLITEPFFFYMRADAPFIDAECMARMQRIHQDYVAEFTFADGYPFGFAPEILNSELLPIIPRLVRKGERLEASTTLFSILERDINAFDIETELASEDMRALRVQLFCDTRNNYLMCKAYAKICAQSGGGVLSAIASHPQVLRQLPMFVSMELTTRHSQKVCYLPQRLQAERDMRSVVRGVQDAQGSAAAHGGALDVEGRVHSGAQQDTQSAAVHGGARSAAHDARGAARSAVQDTQSAAVHGGALDAQQGTQSAAQDTQSAAQDTQSAAHGVQDTQQGRAHSDVQQDAQSAAAHGGASDAQQDTQSAAHDARGEARSAVQDTQSAAVHGGALDAQQGTQSAAQDTQSAAHGVQDTQQGRAHSDAQQDAQSAAAHGGARSAAHDARGAARSAAQDTQSAAHDARGEARSAVQDTQSAAVHGGALDAQQGTQSAAQDTQSAAHGVQDTQQGRAHSDVQQDVQSAAAHGGASDVEGRAHSNVQRADAEDTMPDAACVELDVARVRQVLEQIAELSPQSMVHFSLWGEIALHSEAELILAATNDFPMRFICETSGVGWSAALIEFLQQNALENITWIVALDSNDPACYKEVRGSGFEEAQQFAHTLVERYPTRCYIQATRMHTNEPFLEAFYKYWRQKTEHVIVQKYDHYSGRLDALKVVDISPIKRIPCWHNKRDMVIHADGAVPLCREDVARIHMLGNIHTDTIADIWSAGQKYYELHIQERYPDICVACDEHYTFNN